MNEYRTPTQWTGKPGGGVAEVLWRVTQDHPGRPALAHRVGPHEVVADHLGRPPTRMLGRRDRIRSTAGRRPSPSPVLW